jgi:hypothetical protein
VVSKGASTELILRLRNNNNNNNRPTLDRQSFHGGSSSSSSSIPRRNIDGSYISSLIQDLMWAVSELQLTTASSSAATATTATTTKAENWAIFLHGCLTRDSRGYHGIRHVFEICAGASSLQFLAAAFRNAISYHSIDQDTAQFSPMNARREQELLHGIFVPGTLILAETTLVDASDLLVADIFNFKRGSDLKQFQGLHGAIDVFLSAILASRLLKYSLPLAQIAQIATCLEATIPFRTIQKQQQQQQHGHAHTTTTPLDILYARLAQCNETYGLQLTKGQLVETLQQAADLQNRSVGNMVTDDIAEFLDHTWSLLPEQHSSLRRHALYTLADYYAALYSMTELIRGLQPSTVYVSFRGVPNKDEMRVFHERLQCNLVTSTVYLRVRLFSVAMVSALACLTGGGGPKSFFFGDIPSADRQTERLGDGLPKMMIDSENGDKEGVSQHDEVYDILCGNRMSDTGFDTQNAPLAAYLYRQLGCPAIVKALEHAALPMTEDSAWALLQSLPPAVVGAVGAEVGRVAVSRRKGIERLLGEHFGVHP